VAALYPFLFSLIIRRASYEFYILGCTLGLSLRRYRVHSKARLSWLPTGLDAFVLLGQCRGLFLATTVYAPEATVRLPFAIQAETYATRRGLGTAGCGRKPGAHKQIAEAVRSRELC